MARKIDRFSTDYIGLAWDFHVNPSSCDNPDHYEQYIRCCAIYDMNEGMGVTHIIVENDKILGYITLRASSVVERIDDKIYGEPALEICELAVSEGCERKKVGSDLVDFAIVKATELGSEAIGIKYIVLCADPSAVGFYEKLEFEKLESYGKIPREGWNDYCVPMKMRLR